MKILEPNPPPAGGTLVQSEDTLPETAPTEDMTTHGAGQLKTCKKIATLLKLSRHLPRLLMAEKLSRQTGQPQDGIPG